MLIKTVLLYNPIFLQNVLLIILIFFFHNSSVKSIQSYEMYDSDMISDTMKDKMCQILSKHKDGILCNDFINVFHVSI